LNQTARIVIIGAGTAGLSAGIFACLNGFDPLILEMHNLPGGLCTAWRRRGYTFDGAIRYITSTYEDGTPHQLWWELGILQDAAFHYYDEFSCIEGHDGRQLHFYTNTDQLEAHLLKLAPGDADLIHEFSDGIRSFTRMQLQIDMTAADGREMALIGRKMLPVLLPTLKWRNTSLMAFASRFKDPLLREALPRFFQFSPPDFPIMLCLSTLASMNDRESGYPLGGSLRIARALEERYKALGGRLRYKAKVAEVMVKDDRAYGVRLEGGEEIRADLVINAADSKQAVFKLLGGNYLDEDLKARFEGEMHPSQSILQIGLGVARDFSDQPPIFDFPLPEPVYIGNLRHERLVLKHYCFDPSMAKPGHSVLSLWCAADYDYWRWLAKDKQRYIARKQEAAKTVTEALEQRFPGLAKTVEVVDVATPLTYERYTGNWRGAFAGWAMSTRKMSYMMGKGMPKTLPGLEGFYMCGQWIEPGGNTELSCASGRDVIKDICQEQGQPFYPDHKPATNQGISYAKE